LLHVHFVLEFSAAKLKQSAQKALGKARKSDAGGESLKLVKEICAIIKLFAEFLLRLSGFKYI